MSTNRTVSYITEGKELNGHYLIQREDIIHGKELGITFGWHIGNGSFGNVFHCKYDSRRVALKVTNRELLSETSIESELEVTNILKNISHENVIQFLEVLDNCDKSQYWVLMVWVDAQVMIDILNLNDEAFDESVVKDYFRQLVAGLQFLHSLGIVHRDIKPENILIVGKKEGQDRDVIKYIDFGLAKLVPVDTELNKLDTISSLDTEYKANCTSLLGTQSYMPPELLTSETAIYDAFKADIYSLGIVLYVMLFNIIPFPSDLGIDIFERNYLMQKLKESLIIRYPENSEVSENAKHLIENMICADSDQRYSLQQIIDSNWAQLITH